MPNQPIPPVTDDFWQYLQDCTEPDTRVQPLGEDGWWLRDWLDSRLNDYQARSPCPTCQSRRRKTKDMWSRTGNHRLEVREYCRLCETVLTVHDYRPVLREKLAAGTVLAKDVEILQEELLDASSHP